MTRAFAIAARSALVHLRQKSFFGRSNLKRPMRTNAENWSFNGSMKRTSHDPFSAIFPFGNSFVRWNTSAPFKDGESIYSQAMQAMEEISEVKRKREKERNVKMFEALQSAEEKEGNQRSKGVEVIQTLVKETQKEKKQQLEQSGKESEMLHRAIELLEEAAFVHNHALALVQLGNMALDRAKSSTKTDSTEGKLNDVLTAMELFKKAGLAGSRVGWFNLGQVYWTGFPAVGESDDPVDYDQSKTVVQVVKPDLHEAMEAFMHAIDLGDQDAMYLVGVHRMTSGGRENIHSGLRLVERAAVGGHGGALYYLALLHLNGEPNIGINPCSEEEFVERMNQAVAAGNADASFTRAHSYYHGTEGYPQDYARALEDFLLAADCGHADAAVSAGAMLHTGTGVPRDQRAAFELYQAAGEMGSLDGWKNVVACYTTGEGVPQSLKTAQYITKTILKGENADVQ